MVKLWIPTLLIHILCCLAFLALPYLFAPGHFTRLATLPDNQHDRTNLLTYCLMLLFFYANYYLLIPRLYFTRRYGYYVISVLACFVVIVSLLIVVDRQDLFQPDKPPIHGQMPDHRPMQPAPPPFKPGPQSRASGKPVDKPPFGFELSLALYLFLVGLFVSLALRVSGRLRESEQARLSTELSYLKAQINPHFLFNTLNSIYALSIEKSDETPDAIARLSALMRYVLTDATADQVPLTRDLEYIRNYIALQQTRLADTVRVDFEVTGSLAGLTIAPLVLISFIENAFKYGVNPEAQSTITIALSVADDQLHLFVENAKVRRVAVEESSFGIGIQNTVNRLQLLYPNRHQMQIHDLPESFVVDLVVTLSS